MLIVDRVDFLLPDILGLRCSFHLFRPQYTQLQGIWPTREPAAVLLPQTQIHKCTNTFHKYNTIYTGSRELAHSHCPAVALLHSWTFLWTTLLSVSSIVASYCCCIVSRLQYCIWCILDNTVAQLHSHRVLFSTLQPHIPSPITLTAFLLLLLILMSVINIVAAMDNQWCISSCFLLGQWLTPYSMLPT